MNSIKLTTGAAILALAVSLPAMAETTQSVTQKSSTVHPDGSVSYESHTVVAKDQPVPTVVTTPGGTTTTTTVVAPAGGTIITPSGTVVTTNATTRVTPGLVTFYYYDPAMKTIVSTADLSDPVISLWDKNNNHVIDNHEFYTNAMIVYEPVEYSKRTYQDIDADGIAELTQEEYTLRLQQMPAYTTLNTDKKDGLTLYEFTGVGFQDADNDNDNQVSYDELKEAFYHQKGLTPKPEKIND